MGNVKRTGKRKTAKKVAKKAKKKTVKSEPTTTAVFGGFNPLVLDDVDTLSTDIVAKLTMLAEQAAGAVDEDVYTQDAMAAYLKLEVVSRNVSGAIGGVLTKLREAAMTHQNSGGVFEQGKCIVTFPVTGGGRSPKWKGEATSKAKALASLDHGVVTILTKAEVRKVRKVAPRGRPRIQRRRMRMLSMRSSKRSRETTTKSKV